MITPSEQFQNERRRKRHRFLIGVIIFLSILLVFPVLWLSYLTADFYFKIQSGEIEDFETVKERRSISNYFANTNPTQEDLDRLMPTGLYPELGNPEARLTIIEFIDYSCPYCKQVSSVLRKVMDAYGEQVHVAIRDFPIVEIHPFARDAAHASRCVLEQGQKAYWRYHEILFANQDDINTDTLRTYAGYANINIARFDACMAERRYDTQIDKDIEIGKAAGVNGTPTFFLNGRIIQGALTERQLTDMIDIALQGLPQ